MAHKTTSIQIEISARHVHLTQEDWTTLFGPSEMTVDHPISQHPQFSAKERVTLRGPKNTLPNVGIVGPVRTYSQAELSQTDAIHLGISPPLTDSGSLAQAATIAIIGPAGEIERPAAIIQQRHIHMNPAEAEKAGVKNNQIVSVEIPGPRGGRLENVIVRVQPDYTARLHLDTDEGNALGVTVGMTAQIVE